MRSSVELNGWTSPQMLRRYGASARSAPARRSYDRVMDDAPLPELPRGWGGGSLLWCDLHEHCLYSVVAVAVWVPRGLAGLGAARKVGGPGLDGVPAGLS